MTSAAMRREMYLPGWVKQAIVACVAIIFVPPGVALSLGSIRIDAARVVMPLVCLAILCNRSKWMPPVKWMWADYLMGGHILIMAFSALHHHGSAGLNNALGVIADVGLAYLIGRILVRNISAYRYFLKVSLLAAGVLGGLAAIESVAGISLLRRAFRVAFKQVPYISLEGGRLSLYRASVSFQVSLLLGLYCAMIFALTIFLSHNKLDLKKWTYRLLIGFAIVGVFASLSSGSWGGMGICLLCLCYDRLSRGFNNRWKLLVAGTITLNLVLSVLSNRGPIKLAIGHLTLNSQTGYIRLAMWDAVNAIMKTHWFLGWGWGENWPRPEWYIWGSIDSFYAVWMVRSGVLSVMLFLGAVVYTWYRLCKGIAKTDHFLEETKSWILATVCLMIIAITVHMWGNLVTAVYMVLGLGPGLVCMLQRESGKGVIKAKNKRKTTKSHGYQDSQPVYTKNVYQRSSL